MKYTKFNSDEFLNNIEKQFIDKRKYQYYISRWVYNQPHAFEKDDLLTCWKNSYNSLRDPDWPDCSHPLDFEKLPKWIQNECRDVHNFSPENWFKTEYEEWIGQEDWKIPAQDLLKTYHVILENIDIIKNKKVVDLACHLGILSFCSLSIGATSVKATNVRSHNIELAKEGAKLFDYEDRFEIVYSDLHEYEKTTEICYGVDTVLLCGIMYHVHDHYDIVKSIVSASPENIIIETEEHPDFIDLSHPAVSWRNEVDENELNGFNNGEKTLSVGLPNPAWFKFMLEQLGYVRTKIQFYNRFPLSDERSNPRSGSVQVFKRLTSLDK